MITNASMNISKNMNVSVSLIEIINIKLNELVRVSVSMTVKPQTHDDYMLLS